MTATSRPGGGEIEPGRVDLRADHEHVARAARADEAVRDGEHVEEARALVADVHHRHTADAEVPLQERRIARHVDVGGQRADEDEVEVRRLDARPGERVARGDGAEIRAAGVARDEAPLADAPCAAGSTRRSCPSRA
jgi:hypothetical protein